MMNQNRSTAPLALAIGLSLLAWSQTGCASSTQSTSSTHATQSQARNEQAKKSDSKQTQYVNFGQPMQGSPTDAIPADVVLTSLDTYDGKQVRLIGQVKEVCAKRGCWMRVAGQDASNSQTVFVKFTCPINGRLIPMEAVDKPVIVEGTLQRAMMSETAARHFAQDGGATPEQLAAIKGPQPVLRMMSASARVMDLPASQQSEFKAVETIN